jgi:hypothetical protein
MSSIVRCSLERLARFLGVKDDHVEDALADERSARRVMSRRGLLTGTVALTASKSFGFLNGSPQEWSIEFVNAVLKGEMGTGWKSARVGGVYAMTGLVAWAAYKSDR